MGGNGSDRIKHVPSDSMCFFLKISTQSSIQDGMGAMGIKTARKEFYSVN